MAPHHYSDMQCYKNQNTMRQEIVFTVCILRLLEPSIFLLQVVSTLQVQRLIARQKALIVDARHSTVWYLNNPPIIVNINLVHQLLVLSVWLLLKEFFLIYMIHSPYFIVSCCRWFSCPHVKMAQ